MNEAASEAPGAEPSERYSRPDGERLLTTAGGDDPPALPARIHAALRALVLDPEFPCVGARSAMNQGSYRFALYDELATDVTADALAADLAAFTAERDAIDGEFHSFIAVFDAPKVIDAEEFEQLLWQQLLLLHRRDLAPWDAEVSSDPAAPRFSFSFAGRAYFVVGLSPAGSRWARTFPWPLLAFNPHDQFERLRASGQFERIQEVIRERDEELEGSINPNLANFGEHTEAAQYSGREVGPDWRCPITFARRAETT